MRLVFFGSDDFAAVHLEVLLASGHEVAACVCPPDRPSGRGMKMSASPVKTSAVRAGLPVLQPENLRDDAVRAELGALAADLFVVIAYGKILPSAVLEIPRRFAVNVHASILPRYRGAAPIQRAVINGESETGLTLIRMNEKLDAGDIIAVKLIPVAPAVTAGQLREEMKGAGPPFLVEVIDRIGRGELKESQFVAQDASKATYAAKVRPEESRIDWEKDAFAVANLMRGLSPRPGVFTMCKGRRLKILDARAYETEHSAAPGSLIEVTGRTFSVACGPRPAGPSTALKIGRVQMQDRKPVDTAAFLAGHSLPTRFSRDPS